MKTLIFFRWIGRWSPQERRLRLFRFVRWTGVVGDGRGHSTMYTLALTPVFFRVERAYNDLAFTIVGVRFHRQRSFGGKHV